MINDKEGLKWLNNRLDGLKPTFRNTKLYKLLKNKLSLAGYWRNLPRGDAKKGYQMGFGKAKGMQ